MTRRRRAGAVVAVTLLALATLGMAHARRLRYAAVPLLDDPSLPPPARHALGSLAALPSRLVVTLPARVTAIAERDGVIFAGTFDAGLYRYDARRDRVPVAVGALSGRERFVDVVLPFGDGVLVGTHRGAILVDGSGQRRAVWAAGEAAAAAVISDGQAILGTAHGVWLGPAATPLALRGPDGEQLRVTALAISAGRLYLGSPAGVYSLPLPLPSQPTEARWQPLVFGAPGASSNVVTALAPIPGGVLAGTDDGGVALVTPAGVRALAFSAAGANDVNPGAILAVGARAGRVLVGTQGGGLLTIDAADDDLQGARPASWPLAHVSALGGGAQLYVGGDDGRILAVAEPR